MNEPERQSQRFDALARSARTLFQNLAAVALLAASGTVVALGPSDLKSYAVAAGQAALAAVAAYVHNLVWPRKQA
ncbi:hypothetical protein [Sinosporangium album]|uniref:hypothetical protein n=1 Tax=Sinosporangium album TaxID=504805 RepID=UPI00115F78F1|nr:hypothetical protein [Sinosporangium album]